jgi:hypothetical protein
MIDRLSDKQVRKVSCLVIKESQMENFRMFALGSLLRGGKGVRVLQETLQPLHAHCRTAGKCFVPRQNTRLLLRWHSSSYAFKIGFPIFFYYFPSVVTLKWVEFFTFLCPCYNSILWPLKWLFLWISHIFFSLVSVHLHTVQCPLFLPRIWLITVLVTYL